MKDLFHQLLGGLPEDSLNCQPSLELPLLKQINVYKVTPTSRQHSDLVTDKCEDKKAWLFSMHDSFPCFYMSFLS